MLMSDGQGEWHRPALPAVFAGLAPSRGPSPRGGVPPGSLGSSPPSPHPRGGLDRAAAFVDAARPGNAHTGNAAAITVTRKQSPSIGITRRLVTTSSSPLRPKVSTIISRQLVPARPASVTL